MGVPMNIVVAFDFSPAAERALAWAVQFQKSYGARLHIVHAFNPVPIAMAGMMAPPPFNADDLRTFETALRDVAARVGADASTEIALAPFPGEAILTCARDRKAELIVCGTHGREGVPRLVLGSVAEHVMRHADCPVVTVRA